MIIALIVLLIIFCILYSTLKAEISFKGKQIYLRVFLFGIPVVKLKPKGEKKKTDIKSTTPEKEAESFKKSTVSLREKIIFFKDVCKTTVRLLRRYASVQGIDLNINVGTGDAAVTAVTTGALWAVVYSLLGAIGSIVYIKNHNVNINPCYQESVFEAEGKCIFKSRLVHIIIIVITIFLRVNRLKSKKVSK